MADKTKVEVVSLRLPSELLKMADAIMPKLKRSEFGVAGRVSRGTVLRLALAKGLEALAAEYQ